MRARASAVLVLVLFPATLFAATVTWSGASDKFWNNAGNWVGGVTPQPGDDLVFADTFGAHDTFNDFPIEMTFHSLTFRPGGTGIGYSVGGNEIFLTGGVDAHNTLRPTTLALPIRLGASQTWTAGAGGLTVNASIDLGPYTLTLVPIGGRITLAQPVGGRGFVIVDGDGTVTSQATNSYTGSTTVKAEATLVCAGCVIVGNVKLDGGHLILTQGPTGNTTTPTTGAIASVGGEAEVGSTGGRAGGLTLDSDSLYAGNQGTLVVTGIVNLGGAHLSYDPPFVATYTLIDNDGVDEVIGTFAGLPEGTTFGGRTINYHGGTGNDVTLFTPAPPGPRSTTTKLFAVPNPVAAGATVTLTATVTATDGPATGGSVTFYEGSDALATATVVNGQAVAIVGPFVRGQHTLTAVYTSGASYVGSSSQPLTLTVFLPPTATTTTLEVSPNPSRPGQAVTLTATVHSASPTPPGIVTLYDDDAILDFETLSGSGSVSFTTSSFTIGAHQLKAVFIPTTAEFAASVSDVVVLEVEPPGKHRAVSH